MKTVKNAKTTSALGRASKRNHDSTSQHQNTTRHKKHILLVDDDSIVRDSLSDLLLSEGYTVVTAENGQQAIALAAAQEFDLALLDLNMPVKNGWDTFEHLSREHPLLPVIIATARPNQLFTALAAGVGALLEKPMEIPMLLRTIEKLLAETSDQRLSRLTGKPTDFHFKPAKRISKPGITKKQP